MPNDIHPRHHCEATESAASIESYDGSHDSTLPSPRRVPTHSFDQLNRLSTDLDIEHGRIRSIRRRSSCWSAVNHIMTIRARTKQSLGTDRNMYKDGFKGERLINGGNVTKGIKYKRSTWNYCVFGGISGLTILLFVLATNLLLMFATYAWSSEYDPVLQNWGRPGSGTESLAWYPTDFTRDVQPIPCHSHNDYWRKVPLFSALRAGCTGVEADVWLFDEDLYVGHNTASLTRNRTFTSLYIDPLVKILEDQNKPTDFYNGTDHGVFDADPGKSLTLLVDVKTDGKVTWPWVLKQLQPLRERGWLSYMEDGEVHMRQITVVGTGETPFDVLTANTTYRDAFFDAPLDLMWEPKHKTAETMDWPEFDDSQPGEWLSEDEGSAEEEAAASHTTSALRSVMTAPAPDGGGGQGQVGITPDTHFNSTNSYYASVAFGPAVGRIWRGRLSPRQMKVIRGQIRGAHRRGLKVRYWDLPAWPIGLRNHVWDVLVREGVDMLNVDDLKAASRRKW